MKTHSIKNLALIAALAVLFTLLSTSAHADSATSAAAPAETFSIELAFLTHLDMDLPEQDAFIERVEGSDEVYRVTKGDNDMSLPLYKTAVPISHNPFSPAAVGPHPKGEPMGMTLGEWLRHHGTGTYTCKDGEGSLDTSFVGLVPDGIYTMWHAFMALPPTQPFSGTLDLPLGARDGSESIFTADGEGKASFVHRFRPCLELSDVWTTSMLAIAWHSDEKTYGAHPGDWGLNSHIPLFLMLPPREGIQ